MGGSGSKTNGPSAAASVSIISRSTAKTRKKILGRLRSRTSYKGIQRWTMDSMMHSDYYVIITEEKYCNLVFISSHPDVWAWDEDEQKKMLKDYERKEKVQCDVEYNELKKALDELDRHDDVEMGRFLMDTFNFLKDEKEKESILKSKETESLLESKRTETLLKSIEAVATNFDFAGIARYKPLTKSEPDESNTDVFVIDTKSGADTTGFVILYADGNPAIQANAEQKKSILEAYKRSPCNHIEHEINFYDLRERCLQKQRGEDSIHEEPHTMVCICWRYLQKEDRKQQTDSAGTIINVNQVNNNKQTNKNNNINVGDEDFDDVDDEAGAY